MEGQHYWLSIKARVPYHPLAGPSGPIGTRLSVFRGWRFSLAWCGGRSSFLPSILPLVPPELLRIFLDRRMLVVELQNWYRNLRNRRWEWAFSSRIGMCGSKTLSHLLFRKFLYLVFMREVYWHWFCRTALSLLFSPFPNPTNVHCGFLTFFTISSAPSAW